MIEIIVEQDKIKTVGGVWQYDIGEKLRITGIDLTGCQMQWDYASLSQGTDNRHFEPLEGNTDLTLGGECAIPDQALTVLGEVNGYIYYTDGTPKGETLAVMRIELKERPRPTDYVSNDNIATLEMLIDNRIGDMKFIVASEDELPENPVNGAEAIVREALRIGTVVSGTVERIYINDDFIPTGDHRAEFESPQTQTSRVRHLVSAKIADKLVEPVEGVPAVVVPLPSLAEAVIYVKVYADISSAFYGELKAGWNRVVFDPATFAHIDTFSAVFDELPLLEDCTIITESNTRGFLSSHPWQEKLTHYYAINGAWYKIGSEAIEYADLDAPYAGYPFRHAPSGKIVEQEHYILPLDVPLKLYVNPVPPVTDVVSFYDRTSEYYFFILPPEYSGVEVNLASFEQELGLNENGEEVVAQYLYAPQEVTFMGNTMQKGWYYLNRVDEVPDFTILRPISYDEVPIMLVTIIDDGDAYRWEPAGGTYLSETPYLSEGSLYYWNGTEYVKFVDNKIIVDTELDLPAYPADGLDAIVREYELKTDGNAITEGFYEEIFVNYNLPLEQIRGFSILIVSEEDVFIGFFEQAELVGNPFAGQTIVVTIDGFDTIYVKANAQESDMGNLFQGWNKAVFNDEGAFIVTAIEVSQLPQIKNIDVIGQDINTEYVSDSSFYWESKPFYSLDGKWNEYKLKVSKPTLYIKGRDNDNIIIKDTVRIINSMNIESGIYAPATSMDSAKFFSWEIEPVTYYIPPATPLTIEGLTAAYKLLLTSLFPGEMPDIITVSLKHDSEKGFSGVVGNTNYFYVTYTDTVTGEEWTETGTRAITIALGD